MRHAPLYHYDSRAIPLSLLGSGSYTTMVLMGPLYLVPPPRTRAPTTAKLSHTQMLRPHLPASSWIAFLFVTLPSFQMTSLWLFQICHSLA